MPQKKTVSGRSKPKSKVRVGNTTSKSSGKLGALRTRSGMLLAAFAFVCVGAITLSWAQAATTTTSLWPNNPVPQTITDSDTQSVELGVKFKAQYAGEIQAVRFYKGAQNTGTHIGNLWSNDGKKLATATFTNETSSGWQTATFAQPVAIAANTTYTASYFAPKGHYSVNQDYFKSARVSGPLTALKNGAERGNGVYAYSSKSTYPKDSYRSSNYWVDVVFSTKRFNPTPLPAAPTNPTAAVSGKSVTVKWTDSVTTGVHHYEVARDGTVIGTNTTGAGYIDANLTAGKTYAYQVRAVDSAGQQSAWSSTVKATIQADTPTPSDPGPTTPTPPTTPSTSTCPLPKYPTPACAGYRNGASLQTVSGDLLVTTPNQVIENKRVSGNIDIRTSGVIIRNTEVTGAVINDNTSNHYAFTIEDSTVGPASGCSSFGNGGIGISDYTARRVVVRNFPDGFRVAGGNITIQDSYAQLCSANVNDHSDGIQAYGAAGGKNITIQHNTIDQTKVTNGAATAPIFLPNEDRQGNAGASINVIDNLLAGGGYTLRAYGLDFPNITGNKIVDGSWGYGPLDITCNTIGGWSGNAVVKADLSSGTVLSQVRALNDCN
ncbi:MAG TPA: DUF4082 domain-containing protein [Candidatus Saccharimonadales bacterium]|nr:DUF4082 domain-containing protein [Candidatus Saccharimonadales bacterium]